MTKDEKKSLLAQYGAIRMHTTLLRRECGAISENVQKRFDVLSQDLDEMRRAIEGVELFERVRPVFVACEPGAHLADVETTAGEEPGEGEKIGDFSRVKENPADADAPNIVLVAPSWATYYAVDRTGRMMYMDNTALRTSFRVGAEPRQFGAWYGASGWAIFGGRVCIVEDELVGVDFHELAPRPVGDPMTVASPDLVHTCPKCSGVHIHQPAGRRTATCLTCKTLIWPPTVAFSLHVIHKPEDRA